MARVVDDAGYGSDTQLPFDRCGGVGVGGPKVVDPATQTKRVREGEFGASANCPSGPVDEANEELALFEGNRAGYPRATEQALNIGGEPSAGGIEDGTREVAQDIAIAAAAENIGGAYVTEVYSDPKSRK